jgi:hypothetical protein
LQRFPSLTLCFHRAVLRLPSNLITPDLKKKSVDLLNLLPELPTDSEGNLIAGKILPSGTSNVENPELYPVHPYFLFNSESYNKTSAINAYMKRKFKCNEGWCQDLMVAALLGLSDEATQQVANFHLHFPILTETPPTSLSVLPPAQCPLLA